MLARTNTLVFGVCLSVRHAFFTFPCDNSPKYDRMSFKFGTMLTRTNTLVFGVCLSVRHAFFTFPCDNSPKYDRMSFKIWNNACSYEYLGFWRDGIGGPGGNEADCDILIL